MRELTGLTAISPLGVPLTWGVSVGGAAVLDRSAETFEACAGVSFEQPKVAAATNAAAIPAVGRCGCMGTPPRRSGARAAGKVNQKRSSRTVATSSRLVDPDAASRGAIQKGGIAHRERDPERPPDQRDPQ